MVFNVCYIQKSVQLLKLLENFFFICNQFKHLEKEHKHILTH